ncbi:protein of unknown function [Acidithiobacillus ferrivorans]|uniref:DUF2523 domain-containing protein n=1 Tax=Acidithiobacillus ferrivorans TaxID=160808 RepID=A0A060UUC7_9PROT|nr:DUF2523 family protein [Acidithiobacillus ferrivorans]CDQ10383.1 hypothetical protein AFERRI_400164 [Acidithiobacillus ferrivorans]SMH64410.1 protein of unknown function [Acidithiobacillus ferrivorans]
MINAIYLLLVTLGTWILKNIGPQILLALGVGFVSYTGFSALDANLSTAINAIGSGAASLDTLVHMFGIYNGLQIFLSAISIKVSIAVSKRIFPVRTS